MKKPHVTPLLAAATLFLALGAVGARAEEDAPPPPPEHPGAEMRARMLERFDKNGDGKLDDTEKAAAHEAMREEMRARLSAEPRFLERFDTDHDGKISDAEWAVAKKDFKERRREHGPRGPEARREDRPEGRHHGMADPEFRRGFLLGKYDKNGDGKLDEAERAALRADMEAKLRGRLEKELARLKAIDADGDGKISDAEWAAARDKFKDKLHGLPPGPMGPGGPDAPAPGAPDAPPPVAG